MRNRRREQVNRLFDDLIETIEEVRAELLEPSMSIGDPAFQENVRDLTDVAHLTLHQVIADLCLSPTEGSSLKAAGPGASYRSANSGPRASRMPFAPTPGDDLDRAARALTPDPSDS